MATDSTTTTYVPSTEFDLYLQTMTKVVHEYKHCGVLKQTRVTPRHFPKGTMTAAEAAEYGYRACKRCCD